MRGQQKCGRGPFVALSAILICFSFALTAYAWLVLQKPSDGSFGFSASALSNVNLKMGCVAFGKEESARKYGDVDCVPQTNSFGLAPPEATNDRYSIALSDMAFGSIDNLSRLKPENKIYFRLSIPKALGKTVSLDFFHPSGEDFFTLYQNEYDQNGEVAGQIKVTDPDRIAALKQIITATADVADPAQFLQYTYAFSAKELEANAIETAVNATAEADRLTFSGDENGNPIMVAVQGEQNTAYDLICPDTVYSAASDNYYLYLLLTPDLSVFAKSVDHLAEIMPCFMLFNIKMDIDIH